MNKIYSEENRIGTYSCEIRLLNCQVYFRLLRRRGANRWLCRSLLMMTFRPREKL